MLFKYFFGKHDQIRRKLRIWSHLLKKSLIENFIFCAVFVEVLENLHMSQFEGNTAKMNITARF